MGGFIVSGMLARVRNWFDGAGYFVGGATVLLVFALVMVVLVSQSPDHVRWTGNQVIGTEQNGIVYYRWQGESYTLDDVNGNGSSNAVSVYLDPSDPGQAMLDNLFYRVLTGFLILGPVTGAVVLLVVGGTRNYRRERRKLKRPDLFRF